MNAKQAKELAVKNLKGPVIEPFLNHVYKRVEEAAKKGQFEINNPFHGLEHGIWPTNIQQEAVWQKLREEGFEVKHHPDPDPGDPRSGPYDSVSWINEKDY
jgi:hypothetical protein